MLHDRVCIDMNILKKKQAKMPVDPIYIDLEKKVGRTLTDVEWIHPEADIYDGGHIAFRTGEKVISGVVSLAPRMVEVRMESPYGGISGVETIDADMPVIFTEHPYETSPASLAGKDRARRLLLRLYYSADGTTA